MAVYMFTCCYACPSCDKSLLVVIAHFRRHWVPCVCSLRDRLLAVLAHQSHDWLSQIFNVQVKSTWDENLYTTKLDRTKVAISSAEADRLAREIENSSATNRHLTEERNQSRDTGEEVIQLALLMHAESAACTVGS